MANPPSVGSAACSDGEPLSTSLATFRASLNPGEGYWKLTVVGRSIYGMLIKREPSATRRWRERPVT